MIELTREQALAMAAEKKPLHVLNPLTQEVYVLVRQEVYKLTCNIVDGPIRRGWVDPADDDLIKKRA